MLWCFPAAELLLDAEHSADRALMAAALALMAAVMVAREASRSLVQGEADGGLVVVVAAAGVGVVAVAAAADGGGDRDLNRCFFLDEEDRWTLDTRC